MRFEVTFENGVGELRIVPVQLTLDEVTKAAGDELFQHAFALRHAYPQVPRDFRHVENAVRLIRLN